MIDMESLADCVDIVIGTTTFLSALEHALHKLLLIHFKTHDSFDVCPAFCHKLFQGYGLRYCAWKSVENYTAGSFVGIFVKSMGQHADHKVVRNEMAFGNIAVSYDSQFRAAGYMVAEKFAGRDVMEPETVCETLALSAFTAAWSTKNH